MSLVSTRDRMDLPIGLRRRMLTFRRRVWAVKAAEAIGTAATGVVLAYFVVFGVDRIFDAPAWLRFGLLLTAVATSLIIPWYSHYWVWNHRRLDQLARLLARRMPALGDELLGVVELVRNDREWSRSRALCEAAVVQADRDAGTCDWDRAMPASRHRPCVTAALIGAIAAFGAAWLAPEAAANAWRRFLAPWIPTPRYTFTQLESHADRLVVPHGEPFAFRIRIAPGSPWEPTRGAAILAGREPVFAPLEDGAYSFEFDAQVAPARLDIRIGDARRSIVVEPMLRPELAAVDAIARLPAYLERTRPIRRDVRGGSVSFVHGSEVTLEANANRELGEATIDANPTPPRGSAFMSDPFVVGVPKTGPSDARTPSIEQAGDGNKEPSVEIRRVLWWRDAAGLSGKEPFTLTVLAIGDEPPTIAAAGLPRQRIVLDSEQLAFQVVAGDDFGVRRIGMEWRSAAPGGPSSGEAPGERILAAGDPEMTESTVDGTFCAKTLGIAPQSVEVRLFAEDYAPERGRVYSVPHVLHILDAKDHAIWLTEQLNRWHRQSLEVRDRELQLYETNKQLRELNADALDRPETRRKIETQAAAERANGRRLSGLTAAGEDLVRQASRNPEFGVGHLEKWAEMLGILKDISAARMPSVADLLRDAAQAPRSASTASAPSPGAGQARSTPSSGSSAEPNEAPNAAPSVPTLADVESSQQPPAADAGKDAPPSQGSSPRLTLPATSLAGGVKPGDNNETCPAARQVETAVEQQRDLLAEFDKIAEELNRILANLEGSTLVKRLKAASRNQYKIGGRISDQIDATFGVPQFRHEEAKRTMLGEVARHELESSQVVSTIMDDMQAYFERRRLVNFRKVLDAMRESDVIGGLRQIGDDVVKETGLSIAQCEFWSDALDRWAEELVDPTSGGT